MDTTASSTDVRQALMAGMEVKSTAPASLAGKTVYVVDANSLIFQVYHAIPEMTSPRGEPVNALFGFTRDILYLIETKKPDYLFCAFDLAGPTFRHELYDSYKHTRSEVPQDLSPQFASIHRMLAALRVPVLSVESFEADDILATLARVTSELGGECFLVSGDKDCRQLVSNCVKVYNVRKDHYYDAAALMADWGVRPEQVVDFQALVGDSIDNVPGVPLIGPKIAKELLEKHGTLDEILARAPEMSSGKRKQNLLEFGKQALLSRQLVRLDQYVPFEIDWASGQVTDLARPEAVELCVEYGFRSFAEKLRGQPSSAPPASTVEVRYQTIDTPEALSQFVAELSKQQRIALHVQATHEWPTWSEVLGYAFSWQDGQSYYLPVRGPAGERLLDPVTTLEALRGVLENPAVRKIGQNLKHDLIVLRMAGVALAGMAFDTQVASYLLDAGERNHDLGELAKRLLNHTTTKTASLTGSGKSQTKIDQAPVAQVAHYAAEQADIAWRLEPILSARLADFSLAELFETVELPLIEVLAEIEFNGIQIDSARLASLSQVYGKRLEGLEAEIYGLAGREFNIGSPKQLQQVLFDEQKLPVQKRTKTGPSTDVEVLEQLARQHPLPAKIIEYRQYSKLKNTYVDALPTMVNPRTGRVHASFNQSVAATGRLSSSDPNLQNIPIRNENGREIRSAFRPGHDGWRLVMADYSQIELRVLAHFSGDPTLCGAFERDEDVHALVASQVHGVPLSEVTSAMRRQAKAVNFGVIYGQSPFGLAKQIDVDQKQAAAFIDAYFAKYPGVDEFLTKVLEQCQANGYVSTILGRRRAVRGIRTDAGRGRNLPERTAVNTVIQGSAADLIKQAMIAVHARLRSERLAAKMLLQIHDELIFEAPPEELDAVARLVAEEMSGVMSLAVPINVDVSIGSNWADAQPWIPREAALPASGQ